MNIQVIFDHADRCYQFGDMVSGKITLSENVYDASCSKVWITYGWRTHGRGNRDTGGQEELIVTANKTSIRKGECKKFPFSFKIPNGPVTYHGHYLNVDWYLTVHVISPPGRILKCEEDFLLHDGNPTGVIVLGDKEIKLEDIPTHPPIELPDSIGLVELKARNPKFSSLLSGMLIILFISIFLIWGSNTGSIWSFVGFIVAALSLIYLQRALRHAYRQKLEVGKLWVKPAIVYAGSKVICHLDFSTKSEVYLRRIKASIFAQERVVRLLGTSYSTEYHIVNERTFFKSFEEKFAAGRRISFECALPVDPDAPPTFNSKNNGLEWNVKVQVDLKGWPDWVEIIPITLLPSLNGAVHDKQNEVSSK